MSKGALRKFFSDLGGEGEVGKRPVPSPADQLRPFQLVKFLSLSSFILILASSLILTMFMTNYARREILRKHHEFALLLAENLNHQIYQRFTLPTLIGFGRIELRQPAQYDRLEKVIQSTIYSFHVLDVRIYDIEQVISYATDKTHVGRKVTGDDAVSQALNNGVNSFELQGDQPLLLSFFRFNLKPGSFVMRTVYPLRVERGLNVQGPSGPVVGVLEFSQDITGDYETLVYFQWLITVISLLSSMILFGFLFVIIRRADRVIAERSRERERLEKELHENERLVAMGRVVASIAHEIRNPLGIIRSSSELLLKKALAEKNSSARLLQAIFDESKRLSQTVGDFLDYARPKQPRQDHVDLAAVLDQVMLFLEREFGRSGVRVVREYESGLWTLGDRDLLYRAFYNVVANGLQAMNGAGEIVIRSGGDAERITLSFKDSGPGFDEAVKSRLLEPFFTTKDMGTGLGLAIVANILTSHGATIALENDPLGGARVDMSFPRKNPEARPD